MPLSGSQIVKGKLAGKRHRYRVLSSSGPRAGGEATLLAPSAEAGGGLCRIQVKASLCLYLHKSQQMLREVSELFLETAACTTSFSAIGKALME